MPGSKILAKKIRFVTNERTISRKQVKFLALQYLLNNLVHTLIVISHYYATNWVQCVATGKVYYLIQLDNLGKPLKI